MVLFRPDPTFQEVGHAYIMLEGDTQIGTDVVRDHLKSTLANHKTPKNITRLEALPMLPIVKVDKKKLKENAQAEADACAIRPKATWGGGGPSSRHCRHES
jgi:non-ribosomal peptide synthetase component E (peptide arylation enzyme)